MTQYVVIWPSLTTSIQRSSLSIFTARYRRSRYLHIRSELNRYMFLRWLCVLHSQLGISGFLRLLSFSLSRSAILLDTLCSLGQNCRFQLEGDRYCSILPFVDSIISIDRKLITFDTGFIR
ncbi:unnamed protein product [Photorhabdus laumondii subsp. laumondii TTO1]|uniref:Photorhabdus luminescens subsp. laumondii TTO1 complete genome segment 1/17 n=1 Tax=Photorhabdus laumondii subsp. laumondii (strain DSM 15139 / CIP 105565 / TT01) TaxID=243265 RepID=Q7N9T1_PHOLL|nr:unnamed protein product [Photorhabdus laumondii subsp. laumondii TTO1]